MAISEEKFPTIELACKALAQAMTETIQQAIALRGSALIAVSGGRTPQAVFRYLSEADIDWSKLVVALTDERWVPSHDDASNEKLARNYLLQGVANAAIFIPMFGGESSPDVGFEACEARMSTLALPFDAIYLGMGEDGHFASLFPGEGAIEASGSTCVSVPARGSRQARMSLTAGTILSARQVFLLYAGEEKREKYLQAMEPGSAADLPLRLLLNQAEAALDVLYVD